MFTRELLGTCHLCGRVIKATSNYSTIRDKKTNDLRYICEDCMKEILENAKGDYTKPDR